MNNRQCCESEGPRVLKKGIKAISFLFVLGMWAAGAAASTPDWLRTLAQQPAKHYADDVNAVALLNEQETTVNDNGEILSHGRIAFRILRPEGRDYATYSRPFDHETKLNYLRGWSITAKGQEYEAKDKDAIERSTSTYEIYSDEKERILHVSGGDVGTVVGFEFEQRERPYIFQDIWLFQNVTPVERSRYSLRLPPRWEYRAEWINHAEQAPTNLNGSYLWELTDLPRIEREYHRPPSRALAAQLVITFISEKFKNQAKSWNELGAFHAQLIAGSREPSSALQQQVQALAPAGRPILERIKALARFAQHDIRYAAIEIGIGGLRPHPAAEVFSHRYGDCKDKATLLATMLSQIGVTSYYMPIHTSRGIYTEKSPPVLGFNHVILAIQLPDASFSKPYPALYEHPKLGHLLIFDPTNDVVPFGQIPYYEQDSYALLVTDNGGEFIHLPVSKPESNRMSRKAKMKLMPDGSLQGEVEEVWSGFYAADGRDLKDISLQDRKKVMEHFLGQMVTNVRIDSFDLVNADDIDQDLTVRYKFTAEHYAKSAGPLLLVRPRVLGELAGAFDTTKARHYAYEFPAPFVASDAVEITMPEGFKIDELPDPAKTSFPWGEYTSRTLADGNVLRYTREYRMATTLVPVDRIDQLNKLFSQIMVDEKNMAVLKKAN
jgi:hypothetical protein